MKAKIETLIRNYEIEISLCKTRLDRSDLNADVYTERICVLKEVISDLKRILESEVPNEPNT